MTLMRCAGFWRRFWAFFLDSILIEIVAGRLVWLAIRINGAGMEEVAGSTLQWLGGLASAMVALVCFSMCHFRWGMTAGKRLLGVRVVDARTGGKLGLWQSFGRTAALGPSYALLMMGFLMAAFDPMKRALHDRLAGTLCVCVPKKPASDLEVGQVDVPELA